MTTRITDHADRALRRLLTQYREQPNFAAFVRAALEQVQSLEDVFFELIDERQLPVAVGAQLDVYGRIVGESRNGLSDDRYRTRILARLIVNRSRGRVSDLLAVARTLIGSVGSIRLTELFPGTFEMYFDTPLTLTTAQEAAVMVRQAKAVGISAAVKYRTSSGARFKFGDGTTGSGRGFSNGKLAGAL